MIKYDLDSEVKCGHAY